MSEPTDLYAVRLERTLLLVQEIVAAATQPYGLPADEAIRQLLAVLDDQALVRVMHHNGAAKRHPGAIGLQV